MSDQAKEIIGEARFRGSRAQVSARLTRFRSFYFELAQLMICQIDVELLTDGYRLIFHLQKLLDKG